ncbi:MAG: hypothetical protein JWM91_4680 [Rhodospirillales bacterium]|nr:hypothetical protein [Rhodospirillales bacterium]
MMSDSTVEQDRIEHELARTRARMDSRLSDLQDRLSPGQVLDDVMSYFRGSEGADFARNLMTSVKNNPLPAALTGIGLAWLMSSNAHPNAAAPAAGSESGTSASGDFAIRMRNAEQAVVRISGESDEAYRERADDARGKVLGIQRQAQDTPDSFANRIKDAMAAATQSVTETVHDLRDQASTATARLSDTANYATNQVAQGAQAVQRMTGTFVAVITENPIALGAIGLGVGALLGALVPQSEKEEVALGGLAGEARKTVSGLAQEAVDRGGRVAQRALDAGRESAREQGLTGDTSIVEIVEEAGSGHLAESVKHVAEDVLHASDEALRQDGLGEGELRSDPAPTRAG